LSGSQVIKRRAEVHAAAYSSTIQELRSAGFVSRRTLADELNRRRIPTTRGGRWHYTTVERMLKRLGLITISNVLVNKKAADARAKALASTIHQLRKAGFVANNAIAHELNERRVPTARGGKWHKTTVTRLLERLNRLDCASNTKYRR
jgi:hypothetical protein